MELSTTKYSQLTTAHQDKIFDIAFKDYNLILHIGNVLIHKTSHYTTVVVDMYLDDEGEPIVEYNNPYYPKHSNDRTKAVKLKTIASDFYVYDSTEAELKAKAVEHFLNEPEPEPDKPASESTELMTRNKALLVARKQELILASNRMNAIKTYAMGILKAKASEMNAIVSHMQREIGRISRAIWTIELYLGISEEVHHIKQGLPASDDHPIYLSQSLEFIDELVGDPTNGGYDINNVEDFDEWLLKHSDFYGCANYEMLIPFEKGIKILRVRRTEKDYGKGNPFFSAAMNHLNMTTYMLIRNGDNVYRMYTNINYGKRLFPNVDEFSKLYDELNDPKVLYRSYSMEEKIQDTEDRYKRNFIILQGLIDRTTLLGNLHGKLNLLSNDSHETGLVKFIYNADESRLIMDGSQSFMDWRKGINNQIDYGTRIFIVQNYSNIWTDCSAFSENDLIGYPTMRGWSPSPPQTGVYRVEKYKTSDPDSCYNGAMCIKYLPADEIWDSEDWEYRERKRKVSIELDNTYGYSPKIINYDAISWRDLDKLWAMMHDRRTRRHYWDSMPILLAVHSAKEQEIEQHKSFVKLIQAHRPATTYEQGMDVVHWWCIKNKWRRPVTKDEAKALRMCIKKLNQDARNNATETD